MATKRGSTIHLVVAIQEWVVAVQITRSTPVEEHAAVLWVYLCPVKVHPRRPQARKHRKNPRTPCYARTRYKRSPRTQCLVRPTGGPRAPRPSRARKPRVLHSHKLAAAAQKRGRASGTTTRRRPAALHASLPCLPTARAARRAATLRARAPPALHRLTSSSRPRAGARSRSSCPSSRSAPARSPPRPAPT